MCVRMTTDTSNREQTVTPARNARAGAACTTAQMTATLGDGRRHSSAYNRSIKSNNRSPAGEINKGPIYAYGSTRSLDDQEEERVYVRTCMVW